MICCLFTLHGKWLIQHKDLRLHGEYCCKRPALLLTSAKYCRILLSLSEEACRLEDLIGLFNYPFRRNIKVLRSEHHIIIQLIENIIILRILKNYTASSVKVCDICRKCCIQPSHNHLVSLIRSEQSCDIFCKSTFA